MLKDSDVVIVSAIAYGHPIGATGARIEDCQL
jgi:hypothetical protein